MAKQIPPKKERDVKSIVPSPGWGSDDYGMYMYETNTDYLNKHADEWKPPFGEGRHMHLIYSKQVHWRIVEQGSAVCQIPGRCYRVDIVPFLTPEVREAIAGGVKAMKEGHTTPWKDVEKELL